MLKIFLYFFKMCVFLQNIYTEVREQGACALWALAGHTKTQQKYIAQRISIPHIIQMLLEPTEKLLHVGECCLAKSPQSAGITFRSKCQRQQIFRSRNIINSVTLKQSKSNRGEAN